MVTIPPYGFVQISLIVPFRFSHKHFKNKCVRFRDKNLTQMIHTLRRKVPCDVNTAMKEKGDFEIQLKEDDLND